MVRAVESVHCIILEDERSKNMVYKYSYSLTHTTTYRLDNLSFYNTTYYHPSFASYVHSFLYERLVQIATA